MPTPIPHDDICPGDFLTPTVPREPLSPGDALRVDAVSYPFISCTLYSRTRTPGVSIDLRLVPLMRVTPEYAASRISSPPPTSPTSPIRETHPDTGDF